MESITFDEWYDKEYLPNASGCRVGDRDDMREAWEGSRIRSLKAWMARDREQPKLDWQFTLVEEVAEEWSRIRGIEVVPVCIVAVVD